MPTLYLVRHGRAAADWSSDPDPGLDADGHAQAERMALALAARGPLTLLASPMARTRETAAPLAARWGVQPRIEPRVSEVPAPTEDLAARGRWLREIAVRCWTQLDPALRAWRDRLLGALRELDRDSVVVSHFIAINAAVGAAVGDDRVVQVRPGYCSVTELAVEEGRLRLVALGAEGDTRVL